MEKYAHDATMMHSEQVRAKARKLGRPLSSFRDRDMSLNEAQPSVLVPPDPCPAIPSPVVPAALSINAPHRVHSVFTEQLDDAEAFFSVMEPADDSDADAASPAAPSPQNPAVPTPTTLAAARSGGTWPRGGGTGRIQWHEGVHVREYVPSPRVTAADAPTGGWHDAEAASPREDASPVAEECVSRRASNLSARAGTIDELLDTPTPREDEEEGGGVTRRASNMHGRAGAFDELLTDSGGGGPASHALPDVSPGADSTGGGISRRASNMQGRAGTFEELMATPPPAAAAPRRGPPAALRLDSDGGGAAPSRCASNMAARAGTFEELLLGASGAPEDTDAPSDIESPVAARGAVSRRAANMDDAAGAFDALVDEDGDELPDEEHSEPDAAGPFASPFGAADASFAGMLSDVDVGRIPMEVATGPTRIPSPPSRGTLESPGSRARAAVARLHSVTTGDLIDLRGSWHSIGGSLPSDVAAVMDESSEENPLVEDAAPGPPRGGVSAASSIETIQAGPHAGHASLRISETRSSGPLLATTSSFAVPPPRAASLARIRTPRGPLHVPTDFAVVSVPPSAAATPSASRATSLSAQLSIRTPCKSLGTFHPPPPVATGAAPLLSAAASMASDTTNALGATLSVRTPRKVYAKVGDEEESAPPVDTGAVSREWLQKMVSLKKDSAASVLQPSEWAAGLVERGASVGAKQRGMDASGQLGATMFAAFRPGMDLL